MTEIIHETGERRASDGYELYHERWSAAETPRGRVVILHGVQSHAGWYRGLGQVLAERGWEAYFPDRRGSGRNRGERGHTPSATRLYDDQIELLRDLRALRPARPVALAGISWGGKLAAILAAREPTLVDAVALICPGLYPRVGVSRLEKLRIGLALLTNPRKPFPIPLGDPALFTASDAGRAFIAGDPLALRAATASLMFASSVIDRAVQRVPPRLKQPALLMLAGHDRSVDNAKNRAYFERLNSTHKRVIEYPDAHHTFEFEPDPSQYARDLVNWFDHTFTS